MKKIRVLSLNLVNQLTGSRIDPSRTVVINGFWRSGTTWIQEQISYATNSKSIFEPFQARAHYIPDYLKSINLENREYRFINGLMPYLGDLSKNSSLSKLIDRAQRGQLVNRHVLRYESPSINRSLCRRVVVKYTRGSLCLRAIADKYHCPIVHVRRDPRAVITSIKKSQKSWGEGAFDDFSLKSHLLHISDGRREYFCQWEDEIEKIERTNDFGRIAGYYCLTERYLQDRFKSKFDKFSLLQYEDLVCKGQSFLIEVMQKIDVDIGISGEHFYKPSSTQYDNHNDSQNLKCRLHSWKKKLSREEIESIESVVQLLKMENFLVDT